MRKKTISCLLTIFLCLCFAFSASYIAAHIHHHCSGEDCPICREIKACTLFLHTITAAVVFTEGTKVAFHWSKELPIPAFHGRRALTLVSLKVKLSD